MSLQLVSFVGDVVQRVQDILDFKGTPSQLKHFKDEMSLGRVGVCGFLLGLGFGGHLCGIVISICAEYFLGSVWWHLPLLSWSTYVAIMCNFHFLEFFITAVRQSGNKLSCNSFVLNHSKSYTVAVLFSWLEFWLRQFVFFLMGFRDNWYGHKYLFYTLGLLFVLVGQCIRSLAMWQCGENFNHIIMEKQCESHRLVTSGIYSFLRHPSYFGWFYWSIGTQIILHNPISTLAYFYASWKFFHERIAFEEKTLTQFYKDEYLSYKRRTVIGIPFI